jgi:hypothetical protein
MAKSITVGMLVDGERHMAKSILLVCGAIDMADQWCGQ